MKCQELPWRDLVCATTHLRDHSEYCRKELQRSCWTVELFFISMPSSCQHVGFVSSSGQAVKFFDLLHGKLSKKIDGQDIRITDFVKPAAFIFLHSGKHRRYFYSIKRTGKLYLALITGCVPPATTSPRILEECPMSSYGGPS